MIQVTISTPSENIYSGEAKKITISTSTGEITVLAGHEPLITTIDAGQIIIERETPKVKKEIEVKDKDLEVFEAKLIYTAFNGVANIENHKGKTKVSVLIESSEDVKSIDEKSLKESMERAKQANVEKMEEFGLEINSELLRDLNRIKLARRYSR